MQQTIIVAHSLCGITHSHVTSKWIDWLGFNGTVSKI